MHMHMRIVLHFLHFFKIPMFFLFETFILIVNNVSLFGNILALSLSYHMARPPTFICLYLSSFHMNFLKMCYYSMLQLLWNWWSIREKERKQPPCKFEEAHAHAKELSDDHIQLSRPAQTRPDPILIEGYGFQFSEFYG